MLLLYWKSNKWKIETFFNIYFLGYKFIIRGNIDGKPCGEHKYQPLKFWTNSSSDCVFVKTNCTGEGQIIFSKGNSTSNRKCRCDYTSGYAFVSTPINGCSCDPTLEDCSCHLLLCQPLQVLTPGKKLKVAWINIGIT